MVVPHNALHGRVRFPQIPELDKTIFAAGDEAEGLVGIVVQVSHRKTMRLGYRGCCSVKPAGVGQWLVTIRAGNHSQDGRVKRVCSG